MSELLSVCHSFVNVILQRRNLRIIIPLEDKEDILAKENFLPWSPQELLRLFDVKLTLGLGMRWSPIAFLTEFENEHGDSIEIHDNLHNHDDKMLLLTSKFITWVFGFPIDGTIVEQEWQEWYVAGFTGYRVIKTAWYDRISKMSPKDVMTSVGFPHVLPVHPSYSLEYLADMEFLQSFANKLGNLTALHGWDDLLQARSKNPNVIVLNGQTYPNPVPDTLRIPLSEIDRHIKTVEAMASREVLYRYLEGLVGPMDMYKSYVDDFRAVHDRYSEGQIWGAILKAHKRNLEAFADPDTRRLLERLLLQEQLANVKNELEKLTTVEIAIKEEKRHVGPPPYSTQPLQVSVRVLITDGGTEPVPGRTYAYKWHFRQSRGHYVGLREWIDGPTTNPYSSILVPVSWGDGLLTCELFVYYKGTLVYQVSAEGATKITLYFDCMRCGKSFQPQRNYHGDCRFHPRNSPTYEYLNQQAQFGSYGRNWKYFLKTLQMSWSCLEKVEKDDDQEYGIEMRKKWFLEVLDEFMQDQAPDIHLARNIRWRSVDESIFQIFLDNLDYYPFFKLLRYLRNFPWKAAAVGMIAISEEARAWTSKIPLSYLNVIENKITQALVKLKYTGLVQETLVREQLESMLSTTVWIDDEISNQIRQAIGEGPYGYDDTQGMWKCCLQRDRFVLTSSILY